MNNNFYLKIAYTNLRKNSSIYIPHIIANIATIVTFYIMLSISLNDGISNMQGGNSLKTILMFGGCLIAIFSVVFLLYTNSFLIKRRKKELGLYNILGMSKIHIAKVILYESMITTIISIFGGILGGVVVGKLLFLILLNLIRFDVTLVYTISLPAFIITIILFTAIFGIIVLVNLWHVKVNDPIDLLKAGQFGEKEPKGKWLMSLIGIFSLVGGYSIAQLVNEPLNALNIFFIAVILVVIGTFLLFTTGSIALLKILRKNNKVYYKSDYFFTISTMIYRMKQNAIGLSNICILSTMVLVTFSTTISLYIGKEELLKYKIHLTEEMFYVIYGGFLFIGLFLGILFIMATALIIYYKQISEGYDDHDRYVIMKKIGLSHKEVKKLINRQIMLMFFLPLSGAAIHMLFAFRVIVNLLELFGLTNIKLFAVCTLATILVFILIYGIIYKFTARVYYKLVKS